MISQCPDYFDVIGENQCENRKGLGSCLGTINFSDPKYRGHEGLKEKKEWAKGCGVTWDGITNKFPEESSVGQIFITENQDNDLKESCKLELNVGEKSNKTIYDSSGNSNKGMLIGDYRIKKNRKNQPMKRDSFIKTPDKAGNTEGAL